MFPKNSPILGLNTGEISGKFWGIGPQMVPWKKVPNYVYWVDQMQPVKKFSCSDCNYMARSAACLKQHKRIKHEGVRYPCDECGYAATISSDLRKHKQSIHEGIKYPCDLCEFAASTQSNLKHHKQSKHEGVRFYCDQECFYFK